MITEGRGQAVAMGLAQQERGRLLHWNAIVFLKRLQRVHLCVAFVAKVHGAGGAVYGGSLVALVAVLAAARAFAHQFDFTRGCCSCGHRLESENNLRDAPVICEF